MSYTGFPLVCQFQPTKPLYEVSVWFLPAPDDPHVLSVVPFRPRAGPGSFSVTKFSCTSCLAQCKSKACFFASFVIPLASRKNSKERFHRLQRGPTTSRITCAIERVYVSEFDVHGHIFSAHVGKFPCLSSSPIVESKYMHSSYGLNRITTIEQGIAILNFSTHVLSPGYPIIAFAYPGIHYTDFNFLFHFRFSFSYEIWKTDYKSFFVFRFRPKAVKLTFTLK